MLLVDVVVRASPIEGLGVFAKHAIAAGTPMWRLDERFDRVVPRALYESMEGPQRAWLDRYGYPYVGDDSRIVFELDDAKYMNHSDRPNMAYASATTAVAARDIAAGEEITVDYSTFLPGGFEFLGER